MTFAALAVCDVLCRKTMPGYFREKQDACVLGQRRRPGVWVVEEDRSQVSWI